MKRKGVIAAYSAQMFDTIWPLFDEAGVAALLSVSFETIPFDIATDASIVVLVVSESIPPSSFIPDLFRFRTQLPAAGLLLLHYGPIASDMHELSTMCTAILSMPMDSLAFGNRLKEIINKVEANLLAGVSVEQSRFSVAAYLAHSGRITKEQLKAAEQLHLRSGFTVDDALVDLGYIEEEEKLTLLSNHYSIPFATLRQFSDAPLDVIGLIPEYIAQRFNCVALSREGSTLTVAISDCSNLQAIDTVRDLTMMSIVPVLGRKQEITTTIHRAYRIISIRAEATRLIENLEKERLRQNVKDFGDTDSSIIEFVNLLLQYAVILKASDIHIEPFTSSLQVRVRVDGKLQILLEPPLHAHAAIVARVKILSNLDIAERRLPQDGRLEFVNHDHSVDVRVSLLPSTHGEKVVLRILDKQSFERSIATLGFKERERAIFERQVRSPYGMIISTGPTGSGKSTTLYAAVQTVKNENINIITVEDPVEFDIEGITQVQANSKIGLTFSAALRSILRQDPDIILIGEIRDAETADIAIKMSLTGHLVFSTLHTNDAASAIARFIDIGVPPLLLSSSLNCIVAQRLVRRICPNCATPYTPSEHVIAHLGLDAGSQTRFYKGIGCVLCNGTGYAGRTGIFEILEMTKEIRDLVIKGASTRTINETARALGMHNLRETGIERALAGETTLEEVLAVTSDGV